METIKRLEAIKQELIKANSPKNSQQALALWKEMHLFKPTKKSVIKPYFATLISFKLL